MFWALINLLSAVATWNYPSLWPLEITCLVGWFLTDLRDYRAGRAVERRLVRRR